MPVEDHSKVPTNDPKDAQGMGSGGSDLGNGGGTGGSTGGGGGPTALGNLSTSGGTDLGRGTDSGSETDLEQMAEAIKTHCQ